jgi:polynucleotide 5'-hydroxyl-kinase GRC3/NOL9
MDAMQVQVPRAWEQLALDRLRGTLMVIGGTDVGKSTFARYVYRRLCAQGRRVAYLDGDPGQSTLGPPATMTLALDTGREASFPPAGRVWRWFVGAVSPRGHMLPLVVGAARLAQAAYGAGADGVVYDTTGLINPQHGGIALKLAKMDLLHPAAVFAIQRAYELESFLVALRRSRRVRVIDLRPCPAVQRRDVPTRQEHRAAQFARYFAGARSLAVNWERLAVLPSLRFAVDRLLALEDTQGFTRGLGIVQGHDARKRQVVLYTPLASLDRVDVLRMGDVLVDPQTFQDQRFVHM